MKAVLQKSMLHTYIQTIMMSLQPMRRVTLHHLPQKSHWNRPPISELNLNFQLSKLKGNEHSDSTKIVRPKYCINRISKLTVFLKLYAVGALRIVLYRQAFLFAVYKTSLFKFSVEEYLHKNVEK